MRGGSAMFWRALALDVSCDLQQIKGHMNAEKYQAVLLDHFIPFGPLLG